MARWQAVAAFAGTSPAVALVLATGSFQPYVPFSVRAARAMLMTLMVVSPVAWLLWRVPARDAAHGVLRGLGVWAMSWSVAWCVGVVVSAVPVAAGGGLVELVRTLAVYAFFGGFVLLFPGLIWLLPTSLLAIAAGAALGWRQGGGPAPAGPP